MASPLSEAIESARGLMRQGYNPQALRQQLQGAAGQPRVASPLNNIYNVTAGQSAGAPAKQFFGAGAPQGVNPQLWQFLGRQQAQNPNRGGIGGPVANPGGLTNNVPTYLNPNAPNKQGVERFK